MSLAEEIKRVLMENPKILVEVLLAKPEIIYEALAKLTPWQELATRRDIEELRREMATKQNLEELRKEMATKRELEELRSIMATKQDLEELRREMVTKQEFERSLRLVFIRLDALGARWGVLSEDAFRDGVKEILKDAGYSIDRWLYYDADGYVYGYPSEVELDIVVKDGLTMAVEITSSLRRGDLNFIKRKVDLYTRITGKAVSKVMVITPFIMDRNPSYVKAMADKMGIRVITPEEATEH
ncbi:MAG: PD-(D/E)XK nuclease family protein [Vulcanisaeta sp.]